ncbi:hypothetical protein L0665_01925 [Methanogenium marinum]|uniref:Glycine zipper domain-containing protein n=1 Tax=Methanogenium marinum TaxID=348610 RepID=A0A9Q4PXQ2_9EURY|nr:hypothetical protein [Methanogenium marinum]MDE4907378.1 hypothetical protein [Methanogenium marinum]
MPFIYYGQGVSGYYGDFLERLMSHLALEGTEIIGESRREESARMSVRRTGEEGELEIRADGENVKIIYTVTQEKQGGKREVKRGLMGAIAGAGLGSILGGVLNRDRKGIDDAASGALGGAAAGGAYEAYHVSEDSHQERTAFAALLAEKVKEVEDELQYTIEGHEKEKEALHEHSRERKTEEQEKEEEMRTSLEDTCGDLLALREEVDILEEEGQNVGKAKSRAERAEKLYHEAEEACDAREYSKSRTKLKATVSMIESAQTMLSEE